MTITCNVNLSTLLRIYMRISIYTHTFIYVELYIFINVYIYININIYRKFLILIYIYIRLGPKNVCQLDSSWQYGEVNWIHSSVITYPDNYARIILIQHINMYAEGICILFWPDKVAEWVERPSPILGDQGIRTSQVHVWSESNRWLKNWYLPLPWNKLDILRTEQGLVGWVSG